MKVDEWTSEDVHTSGGGELPVSYTHLKSVYPSQKDCVWMLLQNGGGICDHEVLRLSLIHI